MTASETNGYHDAVKTAREFVCGECGNPLVVLNRNNAYIAICGKDRSHSGIRSHSDVAKDEIRERLERDPQTSQMLAVQGFSGGVPLPSETVRALSQEQIKNRLTVKFGGIRELTAELRGEGIALCLRWGLDPVTDLTLYHERWMVTYEGRLRKLRENTELSPPKVEPLTPDEKLLWGFPVDDLVYRCQIWRRGVSQPYEDFGWVKQEEIKNGGKTPLATHPQLMALKRAIGRCSRQASGIDLPTYDATSRTVVLDVDEIPRQPRQPKVLEDAETRARKHFWKIARDELGMNDAEVHATLGVESLRDYPGGYDQALADLTSRVQTRPKEAAEDPDDLAQLPF
jgi:transcription initiation factor IIE alpha subunit